MNIADNLDRAAKAAPGKIALIFEGRSWTYRELHDRCAVLAGAIRKFGVEPGDRVALFLPNSPSFIIVYFAVQKVGAIAVSLNANLKAPEVRNLWENCSPRYLFAAPEQCTQVPAEFLDRTIVCEGSSEAAAWSFEDFVADSNPLPTTDRQAQDPAAILYTSGTGGAPRGVTLSQRNLATNTADFALRAGYRADDRYLLFVPLHHCYGQNVVLNGAIHAMGTLVLEPSFQPERIVRTIREQGVTMFFGVPPVFHALLGAAEPSELSTLRFCLSGAARLTPDTIQRWWKRFGIAIHNGYGATETSPFACSNADTVQHPDSIGKPPESVELRVVDPEGAPLPVGETGEIAVRGPNVMLGYWNQPESTGEVLRDGWFHTGDLGFVDDAGRYFVLDRVRDMINVGGVKVYPGEIEASLEEHPAVARSAVYGLPDPVMGERVCADIILADESDPIDVEAIRIFLGERISDDKIPQVVRFVQDIPTGPTGKILKRKLRERESESEQREASVRRRSREEIRAWLCRQLAVELGCDDVSTDRPFAELGLPSLRAVALAERVQRWLGRPVDSVALWNFATVDALVEHLARVEGAASEEDLGLAHLSDEELRSVLEEEIGKPARFPG